jgi:ethanolamine ammonia-lyase small subunit
MSDQIRPPGNLPANVDVPAADVRMATPARIALARTGVSIGTRHALEFALAHAQARDAVHSALAIPSLLAALQDCHLDVLTVRSAVSDRTEYLRRPNLGRILAPASARLLSEKARTSASGSPSLPTLTLVLADGLSALAVERHALPLLDMLLPLLRSAVPSWNLAPLIIAEQARVALGDEIGAALGADLTLMLIGERPGLSSPASLGAYLTWGPRPGRTDAERNCVSNIHADGLDYPSAASKILWFATQARQMQTTGITLRDNAPIGLASGSAG